MARVAGCQRSEHNLTLGLLLLSEDERSAALDGVASLDLALLAGLLVLDDSLKLDGGLLSQLGLLAEDGFGLATKSLLLGIVTTLSLSSGGVLTLLVLSNLPGDVLACFFAVCVLAFRIVDHLL